MDNKNKFHEFIQKVDELDAKSQTQAAQADYDLSELDISFDKIGGA